MVMMRTKQEQCLQETPLTMVGRLLWLVLELSDLMHVQGYLKLLHFQNYRCLLHFKLRSLYGGGEIRLILFRYTLSITCRLHNYGREDLFQIERQDKNSYNSILMINPMASGCRIPRQNRMSLIPTITATDQQNKRGSTYFAKLKQPFLQPQLGHTKLPNLH